MAAFTADASNPMLDWLVGRTTPAAVATRYITTFNGDPQGAGAENISTLTGSANRISLTAAFGTGAAASSIASDAAIVFTSSAAGGATVNYVAVYSAITAGTLYASASVTSKTLAALDGLQILTGNCTFSIS